MIELRHGPRDVPLVACAALCFSKASTRLVIRLLARSDTELERLRGVHGKDFVLVCGEAADLPWVDGIRYFGKDTTAPQLLLPTAESPTMHAALLELAVLRRVSGQVDAAPGPFVLCFGPPRVIPIGLAQPLNRAALQSWLSTSGGEPSP